MSFRPQRSRASGFAFILTVSGVAALYSTSNQQAYASILRGAQVKAGFARKDVAATRPLVSGAYGVHVGLPNASRRSEGAHDPLFASAAAFEQSPPERNASTR